MPYGGSSALNGTLHVDCGSDSSCGTSTLQRFALGAELICAHNRHDPTQVSFSLPRADLWLALLLLPGAGVLAALVMLGWAAARVLRVLWLTRAQPLNKSGYLPLAQ